MPSLLAGAGSDDSAEAMIQTALDKVSENDSSGREKERQRTRETPDLIPLV
jgi:hypothetical protein